MGLTHNKIFLSAFFGGLAMVIFPELAFAEGGTVGGAGKSNAFISGAKSLLSTGSVGGKALGGWNIGIGPEAGGIAAALCEIVRWFQGGLGQSIASLAIIFLGISAFFGKVTWGTAVVVAVGVFAIFGSEEIINVITGGAAQGCCGGLQVSGSIGAIGGQGCFKF